MKDIYPREMEVEIENPYKMVLSFYDGKEPKKSQMIIYHVLEGLDLIYNKFNTYTSPEPAEKTEKEYIEINYCKRGVFECKIAKDKYLYLSEGEISANTNTIKRETSGFTLGFYEGVEILIDVEKFQKNLPDMFIDIVKNIEYLKEVLEENKRGIVLKPIREMLHVFDELCVMDPAHNQMHVRLKILELLLVFTTIPIEDRKSQKRYLEKFQIDKIKQIHKELISNLDKKITIQDLARKYEIGTTPLKSYFKEVYGQPIYTYIKDYKIHASLHLLEETSKNINAIAGLLGYDNSSKFAKAFKEKMGCTPTAYRKQKVHLEHERLFGVETD
ncbi:MAG: AraC family transcriptional regulator [Bacilli bacterium]|nr:AraC family transcriptional regulator [Bacilli bacterium]